jgi:hypothetical protein
MILQDQLFFTGRLKQKWRWMPLKLTQAVGFTVGCGGNDLA